ncbi:hypothetical protein EYF80_037855 [Liparis tanakae]|uniref:Uncharacterized protein n=1 Tax=Liparis tanakae TaxID=230148 RepID=A0A4Z2GEH4_9TELE|nr:hypothetical protein EYF80_037855 [Liparis tanakae]
MSEKQFGIRQPERRRRPRASEGHAAESHGRQSESQFRFTDQTLNPKPSGVVLTRLRFSPVAEFEPECVLLELCVPLALLPLEEEEEEEEEMGGAGGGVCERWEDAVEEEE